MKSTIYIIMLVGWSLVGYAQQQNQFYLFNRNAITYNPGMTGVEDFLDVNLTYRNQWVGYDNAPWVSGLSAHSKIAKRETSTMKSPYSLRLSDNQGYKNLVRDSSYSAYTGHAVGGYLLYDKYTPMRDISFFLNYAYHIKLTQRLKWSLGVSFGGVSTAMNADDLSVLEDDDEVFSRFADGVSSDTNADLNLGTTLYTNRFYLGYSVNHLLETKRLEDRSNDQAQYKMHHFISAGYRIRLSPFIEIYPTVLAKYVEPVPVRVDGAVKFRFYEAFTLGAMISSEQTAGAILGFSFDNNLSVGYAYNYPYGTVNNNTSGTHEITLGLALFNFRNSDTKFLW